MVRVSFDRVLLRTKDKITYGSKPQIHGKLSQVIEFPVLRIPGHPAPFDTVVASLEPALKNTHCVVIPNDRQGVEESVWTQSAERFLTFVRNDKMEMFFARTTLPTNVIR